MVLLLVRYVPLMVLEEILQSADAHHQHQWEPNHRLTLRDANGEVELTLIGNEQQLRAWDKSGQLIFEGPCNTPAQLEAIPGEVRPRLERLQKECLSRRTLSAPGTKIPAAGAEAPAR